MIYSITKKKFPTKTKTKDTKSPHKNKNKELLILLKLEFQSRGAQSSGEWVVASRVALPGFS